MKTALTLLLITATFTSISKPVNFGKCNHIKTPLQCKYIKANGRQCLNAQSKADTLCKYHLKSISK